VTNSASSTNQFVMLAVAEKTTRLGDWQSLVYLEALEQVGKILAEEEGQTLQKAARAVLDRAPDEEPPPEDQLSEDMPSSAT
jgi:hypothetical protein